MEWDDLKHFLAVSRTGSLTEAARGLKTSAATVGRRIVALENRLHTRLFDRKTTGYALTEAGKIICIKAEEIERAILAIERTSVGHDLRPTGTVRVASAEDMAAAFIAPNLAQFQRTYPDIAVELTTQMGLVNLVRREADISLRQSRPHEGNLVIRRVGSWPLGLYAAKSYVADRGLKQGRIALAEVGIITWTEEWAHLLGGPWFAQHATESTVVLKANSRRVHQAACKAGLGVAILPSILAGTDPDLICLLPPEKVVILDVWLVVHEDLVRAARVRAVMEFLCDAVSKCK
jgi:DNA-binding transcriptional LysR family regulator